MPRNKEVDSRRTIKDKKIQANKAVDGLTKYYDYLLDKIGRKESLNAEESRIFKNFGKLIAEAEARAKSVSEIKHTLLEGKIKEYVDRIAVQNEIYKASYKVTLTRELYDIVYLDFELIRCLSCNELHPVHMECPWITLAKQCGIEVNSTLTEIKGISKPTDDSTEIDTE